MYITQARFCNTYRPARVQAKFVVPLEQFRRVRYRVRSRSSNRVGLNVWGSRASRSFSRIEVPTKGNQKTKKIAVLLASAVVEWIITGGIFWAPLISAVTMIALTPGYHHSSQEETDLIRRIEQQVRNEYMGKLPQTPPESAEWLNRILSVIWRPYLQPILLKQNLPMLQQRLIDATPKGWVLALENTNLGKQSPILSNLRVFNDVATGNLASVDADLEWNSDTCQLEISGNGPAGQFVVYVYGATLKGSMRFKPAAEDRMILFSFLDSPDVSIKMSAKGPLIGKQDIPRFGFIKGVLLRLLQDAFVEPRQGCLGLDYDFVQGKAVDTQITVKVLQGNGLISSKKTSSPYQSHQESMSSDRPIITIQSSRTQQKGKKKAEERLFFAQISSQQQGIKRSVYCSSVQGGSIATWDKQVTVQLGDAAGRLLIEVFQVPGEIPIGVAKLDVCFMGDGSTGYWSQARNGRPITARRTAGQGPWTVKLPLEGSSFGEIDLEISAASWNMLQVPGAQTTALSISPHTVGIRTVFLQVLEARNLKAMDFGNKSDPYVVVKYNSRTFRGEVVFNSLEPIWNVSYCFEEDGASPLARKVRVEIWDYDRASAHDFLGMVVLNLDLAGDGQVVDQWWQLFGQDQGEVRIRMMVEQGISTNQKVQNSIKKLKDAPVAFGTPAIQVQVVSARFLGTQKTRDIKSEPRTQEGEEEIVEGKTKEQDEEEEVVEDKTKEQDEEEEELQQDICPQCIVKYGKEEQHSVVHQNTTKPIWNYTVWFRHDKARSKITLDIVNKKGIFGGGLGYTEIDIKKLLPSINCRWEGWVPLTGSRSGKGEVQVKLSYCPSSEEQEVKKLPLPSYTQNGNGFKSAADTSIFFEEVEAEKKTDLLSNARETLNKIINQID